jgi:hypothetical protein
MGHRAGHHPPPQRPYRRSVGPRPRVHAPDPDDAGEFQVLARRRSARGHSIRSRSGAALATGGHRGLRRANSVPARRHGRSCGSGATGRSRRLGLERFRARDLSAPVADPAGALSSELRGRAERPQPRRGSVERIASSSGRRGGRGRSSGAVPASPQRPAAPRVHVRGPARRRSGRRREKTSSRWRPGSPTGSGSATTPGQRCSRAASTRSLDWAWPWGGERRRLQALPVWETSWRRRRASIRGTGPWASASLAGKRSQAFSAPSKKWRRASRRRDRSDELSRKLNVELPIAREVSAVLFENKPPRRAVEDLMERESKGEQD